jgi:hypothetical protein
MKVFEGIDARSNGYHRANQVRSLMLTEEEEKYITESAYIPEHLIGLMTSVSGGDAMMIEGFLCFQTPRRFILIGYPLAGHFTVNRLDRAVSLIKKRFKPSHLSLIAPRMSESLSAACREKERDRYYILKTDRIQIKGGIKRNINKARDRVILDRTEQMTLSHQTLSREFIQKKKPPLRVENLLTAMPDYVARNHTALVLNAWKGEHQLAAFYIIDLAATDFSAYIIGCHSKRHYVPGASDLLMAELIEISRARGKAYIHLGLGVNAGIRRFKEKWGGLPAHRYEMCELKLEKPAFLEMIRMFFH